MTERRPQFESATQIGIIYGRDERNLVEKYGKMASPFFRVEISDQNETVLFSQESSVYEGGWDLNGYIVAEVEWDENDCSASMMSFNINNPEGNLQDSRLFAEGNNIDLWMGYDGHAPQFMGRGIVTNIETSFPRDASPSIKITCYDIAHFMMEEGRAEIVPEGTAWWEERAVVVREGEGDTELVDDHISDTDAESEDRARREQERTGNAPPPVPSVDSRGPNEDYSEQAHPINTRRRVIPALQNPAETTMQFRPWSAPRRRRNTGKVWRNLTDAEIVAEIYRSYGIVPYVEATSENTRTQRRLAPPQEGRIVLTNIRDTVQAVRDEVDEINRQLQAQGRELRHPLPTVSVDELGTSFDYQAENIFAERLPEPEQVELEQETGGRRVVQKSGTTDWEFIKQLAAKHGYIVFVFFHYPSRRWIGYWGSPENVPQQQGYVLAWGQGDFTTLGSFQSTLSMRGQSTEIDLQYVDPRTRKEQRLRVAMENISRYSPEFRGPDGSARIQEPIGNGPEVVLTIHGQRRRVVADRNFSSIDDARQWLMSYWIRYADEFCQADGEFVIGFPEIKARAFHEVEGIGRYAGRFFLTKVTHRMAAGSAYTTSFSCYRVPPDMQRRAFQDESSMMTVDINDLGTIVPAFAQTIARWTE